MVKEFGVEKIIPERLDSSLSFSVMLIKITKCGGT